MQPSSCNGEGALPSRLGRPAGPVIEFNKSRDDFMVQATMASRNGPCPCGSGKKYKRCCGEGKGAASAGASVAGPRETIDRGLGYLHSGKLDDAEQCFKEALSVARGDGGLLDLLGVVALHRKRFGEAARYFQQAIARNSDEAEFYNHLAHAMRGERRLEEAVRALKKSIALDPDSVSAHHNLGNAYEELGRLDDAVKAYERAAELAPSDAETLYELAKALRGKGRSQEAERWLRRLLFDDGGNARYWLQLGMAMESESRHGEAEKAYREAISCNPSDENAYARLGAMLVDRGRFEDALSVITSGLENAGEKPSLYYGMTRCRKFRTEDQFLLDKIEEMIKDAQPSQDNEDLENACYALGKTYDDMRQHEKAFHYYNRANTLLAAKRPFDRKRYRQWVDGTLACFGRDAYKGQGWRSDDELPILIVGMPRSGTTLTEQIISSHPEVFGAGELTFWPSVGQMARKAEELTDARIQGMANDYLGLLRKFSPSAKRVIDKLPGNYMYLGLIHRVFPRARIIHCRRHPVDTCLSIYFQNFSAGHEYRYRLDNLAFYYREYRRLMRHWRETLPSEVFLEIQYEDLVENQDAVSHRLIDFCGLEWDERGLEFYKNERSVSTSSNWQVRQPIYKTSTERWRNYEPWIGPLLELLDEK